MIRRFAYRLDDVNQWQPVNWRAFWQQRNQIETIEKLTGDLYDFFVDLDDNKGTLTLGRHTNPIFTNRIEDWIEANRGRPTPADRLAAATNLISFLKTTCESDITVAQRQVTYDYFQRDLADQKQYRDAMAKGFDEVLNDLQ